MYILHTVPHTFCYGNDEENLLNSQDLCYLLITTFVWLTFSIYTWHYSANPKTVNTLIWFWHFAFCSNQAEAMWNNKLIIVTVCSLVFLYDWLFTWNTITFHKFFEFSFEYSHDCPTLYQSVHDQAHLKLKSQSLVHPSSRQLNYYEVTPTSQYISRCYGDSI